MKTAFAILAVIFFAVAPAAAESAKLIPPGHHAKEIHGASYYAPGHEKKRLHMQSSRAVAPGHLKR